MDLEQANIEMFDAKALGVSEIRWRKYIEGVEIKNYITGYKRIDCSGIQITLKGLEYLQENSIMQKIYKASKGIVDVAGAVATIVK